MKKYFPSIIEYQPYSICNANCEYCPVGSINRAQKDKGSPISDAIFDKMLKDTIGKKIDFISPHLNCEPLLCNNLSHQVREWKKIHPNAKVVFSTNCVFLTEKKFLEMAECGVDTLELHYMGISKAFHEKSMKTNYEKVTKNIENALKLKKINNLKINLEIFSHRLKGATLNEWHDFANKWQDKGAIISFGPLWNRAGYYGEDFKNKKLGILKSKDPAPCHKPFKQIAIEHDGRVVLCSLDYHHEIKIGNINDNSIEEIFNNEVIQSFREGQKEHKIKDTKLCNECIRGGRYLMGTEFLTKTITNEKYNKGVKKFLYKQYLNVLENF